MIKHKATGDWSPFLLLHAHARCHPEGGGNGGQHSNDDVQNLAPNFFVHFIFERLRVKGDGVRFSPQSTQSSTEFFLYYSLHFVIQSEAKNLGNTKHWKQVDVLEILPPLRSSG